VVEIPLDFSWQECEESFDSRSLRELCSSLGHD